MKLRIVLMLVALLLGAVAVAYADTNTEQEKGPQSVIEVAIDIKPARCPNVLQATRPGGEAKFAVAILGAGAFDVAQIDLDTVRLEGVAPVRCTPPLDVSTPYPGPFTGDPLDCWVQGPDGYQDQSCIFRTEDVLDTLEPVSPGDQRMLELTGKLLAAYGGFTIRGGGDVSIGPVSPPPDLPPPFDPPPPPVY
jgi:hypothetical protein